MSRTFGATSARHAILVDIDDIERCKGQLNNSNILYRKTNAEYEYRLTGTATSLCTWLFAHGYVTVKFIRNGTGWAL